MNDIVDCKIDTDEQSLEVNVMVLYACISYSNNDQQNNHNQSKNIYMIQNLLIIVRK